MVLLSSHLLIRTHALTLLTVSYCLIYQPSLVTSSSVVWLMGESMHIRDPTGSFTPTASASTEPLAALGLVVAVLALTQFVLAGDLSDTVTAPTTLAGGRNTKSSSVGQARSGTIDIRMKGGGTALGERAAVLHSALSSWMTVSSLQVLVMGALVGYSYMASPGANDSWHPATAVQRSKKSAWTGVGLLVNRVVFAGAFLEMLFWGYLWTALKEESRELAVAVQKNRELQREKEEGWER